MPRILIDLTHNEQYNHIPDNIFEVEYIFEFINPGDPFPTFSELIRYDLLIIGEIIPSKNQKDHLFHENEIRAIKKYFNEGGRLLITTSSGGDFDYKRSNGSLRALSLKTGVKRFWWGELFNNEKNNYYKTPENLIFKQFPSHEIFNGVEKLIFADCTFLEPTESPTTEQILYTTENTHFRYFIDEDEDIIGKVPIIISNIEEKGNNKCLTIGSTLFMTKNKEFGIKIADNGKFFNNLINWLIK